MDLLAKMILFGDLYERGIALRVLANNMNEKARNAINQQIQQEINKNHKLKENPAHVAHTDRIIEADND